MDWKPSPDQARFIKSYAEEMALGNAAIFAGAGLSRAAGYVDWRSLLREIATELDLDIDRETDLIAIAQYHLNEKRHRARLNRAIIEELGRSATPTRAHQILARLPITTAWTTNYDRILERSFEEAGKTVDVKINQENLAQTKPGRDIVLYKMHGCVTQPHEAVLTKDDYEQYERKRPLFAESLKGDLISNTFLFIGFSFTDPNIDYILSRVRVLLGENVREHYCIMCMPARPHRMTSRHKADFEYAKRQIRLKQTDLLRFGIETVWIEDYSHVTPLLNALSSFTHRKSVFISGASHDPEPFDRSSLDDLTRDIGTRLIREGYNLVSGFGLGIGEQCVVGALRALYGMPKAETLNRLLVLPFPQNLNPNNKEQTTRHREELISRSGVVVVLAGNRHHNGETRISPGVLEEVDIAIREGKQVIPIGATGHAARKIWEQAQSNPESYLPGIKASRELGTLGDSEATNNQIINALFSLLGKCEKASRL